MTSIFRSRRKSGTPRRHTTGDPEQAFETKVTIAFIALIVAVIVIVLIAIGYTYWEQHFKAVATVGGSGITRDQWTARAGLETVRLDLQDREVSTALAAGTLTADEANTLKSAIATAKKNVASSSIENLIDLTYQGQLAGARNLTVTDADVDAAIVAESTSPERRHVSVIFVDPSPAGGGTAPTPADLQAVYLKVQQAAADLAAGKAFADVAKQYSSDASKDKGGDYGVIGKDSSLDATFVSALFALPLNGVTPVVKGATDGIYRIGTVTEILAGTVDPNFEHDLNADISSDVYRSNVRMEALADKLEKSVVADASADTEQVHLAEIFLSGDPTVAAADDTGKIRASHILYSPKDDPQGAADIAADDPYWTAAKEEADRSAASLRAITDVEARKAAFAERAKGASDDTISGADGGDLGYFTSSQMVVEFGDPLFNDPNLKSGDIVGPVKTDFGWHVILFVDRVPPLQTRVDDAKAQLAAAGADFGTIAKQISDGAEAAVSGDLGWRTKAQLDPDAQEPVFALDAGKVSDPIALTDGYYIYKVIEKATRPLDAVQLAGVQASAFSDWYDPQKTAAEKAKTITRDPDVFTTTTGLVPGRANL